MKPELLSILVCPETRQRVTPAPEERIKALNRRIAEGSLRNQAGRVIEEPIEGALVREDGLVAYPIRHQIPIMLVEEGIVVASIKGGPAL